MGDTSGTAAGSVGAGVRRETVGIVVVGVGGGKRRFAKGLRMVVILVPEHVALVAVKHEGVNLGVERGHGRKIFGTVR